MKKIFLYLIGLVFLLFAFTVIINLPTFDEELLPEVAAIKNIKPKPYTEGNAYPALIAINSKSGKNMAQATKEIRDFLNQKINQTGLDFLTAEEELRLLDSSNDKSWQNLYKSCGSEKEINCMISLAKEISHKPIKNIRLLEQLGRYAQLIEMNYYEEATQINLDWSFGPYAPVLNIKRLFLANAFINLEIDDFLNTAHKDILFWRMILDDSHLLITQMVAISSIRDDLNSLSMAVQQAALSQIQLNQLQTDIKTLSQTELDLGKTFEYEFKFGMNLFEEPEIIGNAFENLFYQPKATQNTNYRHVIEPLKKASQLNPTEFYQYLTSNTYQESLVPPFSWSLTTLYNPAGKLLIGYALPTYADYNTRVHDLNGMFYLLKLQIEVALNPETPVEQVVKNSQYTNPYTSAPMSYNKDNHSIYFDCMDKHAVCELSL